MLTYTNSVSGASVWPCTDLLNESVQTGFCYSRMHVVLFIGAPPTRHLSATLTNGWFFCGVAALAVSLAEADSVFYKGHNLRIADVAGGCTAGADPSRLWMTAVSVFSTGRRNTPFFLERSSVRHEVSGADILH